MKSTGMTRPLDELGRVVLPKELRDTLNIGVKTPLKIFVDGNLILLQKYEPDCIFCGEADDVSDFKGKNICKNCMNELEK